MKIHIFGYNIIIANESNYFPKIVNRELLYKAHIAITFVFKQP